MTFLLAEPDRPAMSLCLVHVPGLIPTMFTIVVLQTGRAAIALPAQAAQVRKQSLQSMLAFSLQHTPGCSCVT
jgi:hypothetical protein